MKKILAIFLSVAVAISMIPATAFAGEDTDTTIGKVSLSKTSYVYDGDIHKPKVTVYNADMELMDSAYYCTPKYSNSKSKYPGEYTVTVKENDEYEASMTASYVIKPKNITISSTSQSGSSLTVKWKKRTKTQRKQISKIQVQIATDKNFTKGVKTYKVDNDKSSKKFSSLTRGKTYYAHVRTYKNGVYGNWSKTKSVWLKRPVVKMDSTSTGKTYKIIKDGKYAYAAAGKSIYLVNTKKNSKQTVITTKGLTHSLAIRSGYLYYVVDTGYDSYLYRMSLSTGKTKELCSDYGLSYSIKKIDGNYRIVEQSYWDFDNDEPCYNIYKLDGSVVKKYKSGQPSYVGKTSNVSGYKIVKSEGTYLGNEEYSYKVYFKKSNGKKIYLGKYTVNEEDYEGA